MTVRRLLPHLDGEADQLARESLRALARHTSDPAFRELVDDVLAGRRDVRDVLDAPAVHEHFATGLARLREQWDRLTLEERAAQAVRR